MTEPPIPQKPFEEGIEKLIARLRKAELPLNTFNLYQTTDPDHDMRGGAAKRRENLRRYLKALRAPRFALIGLAAGYRGMRFTGVPFTDEARLCFPGSCYDRSSAREQAWREASAGVVMDALGAGTDVVCFNVVPWHPFEPGQPLSNADPDAASVEAGVEMLEWFFERLYPQTQAVSVGRTAQQVLEKIRPGAPHLRHPARGGADEFRTGLEELLGVQ